MKKSILIFAMVLFLTNAFAQWQSAGDKIKTAWAEKIDVKNVLPEYPRPIMERTDWQNLNGLWDYAIVKAGSAEPPNFDGKILVPFAVESSLSGVMKTVGDENELWYKRSFTVPANWKGKKVMLNFGAVDWRSEIYINDIKVGSHQGGYAPFSFDATPFLNKSGDQKLVVKVWDPSDKGFQPRGKQTSRPEGIWYTPVTGIWQTVWLEPVAEKFIKNVRTVSNIDRSSLNVEVTTCATSYADLYEVTVFDGSKQIAFTNSSCEIES